MSSEDQSKLGSTSSPLNPVGLTETRLSMVGVIPLTELSTWLISPLASLDTVRTSPVSRRPVCTKYTFNYGISRYKPIFLTRPTYKFCQIQIKLQMFLGPKLTGLKVFLQNGHWWPDSILACNAMWDINGTLHMYVLWHIEHRFIYGTIATFFGESMVSSILLHWLDYLRGFWKQFDSTTLIPNLPSSTSEILKCCNHIPKVHNWRIQPCLSVIFTKPDWFDRKRITNGQPHSINWVINWVTTSIVRHSLHIPKVPRRLARIDYTFNSGIFRHKTIVCIIF